ncbi:MAG: HNH endonuclease [Planctomycetes bacterium]|nr:HNH endonuclease [Planctomycetota bacterium]
MSMAAYIQHVEELSDDELCSQATQLAGITLKHTAELIAHISVIADKQAFRPEYTSLFAYCMNELGLSEGETHVRSQVANVCRRHPELLDSLGANRMSLTVAGKLAPHLNPENASELIAACEGMTRRQVEEYLVQFKHGTEVTPGIRAVPSTNTLPAPPQDEERCESTPESSSAPNLPVPNLHRPVRRIEPVKPDVFNFRFAASGAFRDKLERLAEVVGVVDVTGNLAKLLDMAIEHALEAKDPRRKLERRRKREARKASAEQGSNAAPATASPRPDLSGQSVCARGLARQIGPLRPDKLVFSGQSRRGWLENARRDARQDWPENWDEVAITIAIDIAPPVIPSKPPSRYVSSELRELVFERASYRCEFVTGGGVRCDERTGLQVDHIVPHGLHGPTVLANLRCLCGVHNRWVAEQVYGEEFMGAKIEEARRKRTGVHGRVLSGQLPLIGG